MKCGDTLLALFAKTDLKTPVEPGLQMIQLGEYILL
jgi:hypothetical protein